jgi:hypothetical protein
MVNSSATRAIAPATSDSNGLGHMQRGCLCAANCRHRSSHNRQTSDRPAKTLAIPSSGEPYSGILAAHQSHRSNEKAEGFGGIDDRRLPTPRLYMLYIPDVYTFFWKMAHFPKLLDLTHADAVVSKTAVSRESTAKFRSKRRQWGAGLQQVPSVISLLRPV